MFSQRRRVEPMQTIYSLRCCEQENSSPACISVILPNGGPSSGKTHISTSARMLRQRFTGPENPVPTVANRPDGTGLQIQGERPS
jgi:hypothetical protein